MGVVVRRYIDILTIIINFPYSTCISSFLGQQHPYFFVYFIFLMFFRSLESTMIYTKITSEPPRKSNGPNFHGAPLRLDELLCMLIQFLATHN